MDRYQALNRMCLNNWHYINRKVLQFHPDINFFTGHSGSGKSTVLDAMQLVLYADTNGRGFFNKAAKEDSDRSLMEYLRGMKNVGENGNATYLRNKNFSSTIVLEFQDTETLEYQCIGVVFDVDTAANDCNRLFFRHKGRLLPDFYRTEDRVMSCAEVRDFLKGSMPKEDIFYARTNEAFRSKLYEEFLGGLDEKKYISLFKRAIPFKMDMKLEEFVKEYICTEQDIHIDDMQESVTQYIRLKRRLEEVKEEIEALGKESEQYKKFYEQEEKREQLSYNLDYMELDYLTEEVNYLTEHQRQLQELQVSKKEEQELLTKELEQLKQERDETLLAIENSGYTHLEKELHSEEDKMRRQLRSDALWKETISNLSAWEAQLPVDMNLRMAFDAVQEGIPTVDELSLLKKAMEEVRGKTSDRRYEAEHKLRELNHEIQGMRTEFASLRQGKKVYPEYLLRVKELLAEGLKKKTGTDVNVDILADLIEVESDTWRNAVEGYMGNNKLSLIVPPYYAKTAMELYQKLDPKEVYRVAVLDTEKVEEYGKKNGRQSGSLAEEVTTEVSYARSYIDFLMGNVIKCQSIDELRENRIGITPDCMLYQGFKLQHINPRSYEEQAYIGKAAMERKLSLLEKTIAEKEQEGNPYRTVVEACDRLLALRYFDHTTDHYLELLADIAALPNTEETIGHLKGRIEELKTRDVGELRVKMKRLEHSIKEKEQSRDTAMTSLFGAEKELERTKQEYLLANEKLETKQKSFFKQPERESDYVQFVAQYPVNQFERNVGRLQIKLQEYKKDSEAEFEKLLQIREEYARKYSYRGFSVSTRENTEYEKLLDDLSSNKLEEFLSRANEQAKTTMNQFKTDFIYKIRDAIRDALQQKDDLNQVLNRLDFGKDRYHFVIGKSRGEEGKFYDMFMDPNLDIRPAALEHEIDNQMNLFSLAHENHYGEYMNELLELFIPPENGDAKALEEARKNLERYADYRTYLSFDMEQRVEGMPVMHLSKMLSKNSGGEGQNPLYVALLASFAQNYRITAGSRIKRRPTPRLVVLDEAFSKMDGEKVGSCIGLIRKLGIQAIISATNDKIQNYVDNVDKTFVFANPNKTNISIQEFEKTEFGELTNHGADSGDY